MPLLAGELKVYYIILEIQNNDDHDVQLMWTQLGEKKDTIVKGNSVMTLEIKLQSRKYPLPIAFQAFDIKDRSLVLLRERKQLFLIPRREKLKEVITIGKVSPSGNLKYGVLSTKLQVFATYLTHCLCRYALTCSSTKIMSVCIYMYYLRFP